MKNKRTFLKCEVCGNMVAVIESSGVKIVCCEKNMTPLASHTTDTGKEKHVPEATLADGLLTVEVGSVPHPMTAKHHIMWIAVVCGEHTQIANLKPEDKPIAHFPVISEELSLYAYCNEHGLWAAEFKNTAENTAACSPEFTEGCKQPGGPDHE